MRAPEVTIDGRRYLAAGTGQHVPRPFNARWLIPRWCGDNPARWVWTTRLSLFGLMPAVWWYVGGWPGLAAALIVPGLPGVWRFNWKFPVLVDAPAMLCALLAADLWRHGDWPGALALVVLAGCIRETSPVFAALYAWNPILLVGLVAPAVASVLIKPGPDVAEANADARYALEHPLRAAWSNHSNMPYGVWSLPWGASLIGLADLSPQLVVTLIVAYAQCIAATDTTRLYQWAAPVMLAAAVHAVPQGWLVALVVLGVSNPFSGSGG